MFSGFTYGRHGEERFKRIAYIAAFCVGAQNLGRGGKFLKELSALAARGKVIGSVCPNRHSFKTAFARRNSGAYRHFFRANGAAENRVFHSRSREHSSVRALYRCACF